MGEVSHQEHYMFVASRWPQILSTQRGRKQEYLWVKDEGEGYSSFTVGPMMKN